MSVRRSVGVSVDGRRDGWSFVPEAEIRKRRSIGPQDFPKREAGVAKAAAAGGGAIFSRLASLLTVDSVVPSHLPPARS